MIQNILGYNFEVEKDGIEHSEEFGSNLALALEKMTSGSYLTAAYNLQIDDRTTDKLRETFSFEEIAQLSEPEILEKIEQTIRDKYNQ